MVARLKKKFLPIDLMLKKKKLNSLSEVIHKDFRLQLQFTTRTPNNCELETDRISLLDIPQQTSGTVTLLVDNP